MGPNDHVQYARNHYSVPPEHAGRRVWVRAGDRMVEVFRSHAGERIAVHPRQSGVNRYCTDPSHMRPFHRRILERAGQEARPADYQEWLLLQAEGIGTEALDWAHRCLASRDFPQQAFRTVRGMVDLAGKHGNAAVEQACARCLGRGRLSAAAVRQEVQRRAAPVRQKPQEPIPDHPNVRAAAAFKRTTGGDRS